MRNSEVKICLENLIKIYGDKPRLALELFRGGKTGDEILKLTNQIVSIADISLNINRGELFVIMGLSGFGKSTLVRCINRLIQPTSGHIIPLFCQTPKTFVISKFWSLYREKDCSIFF